MVKRIHFSLAALALSAGAGLAGPSLVNEPAVAAQLPVQIGHRTFTPSDLTVHAGDTVTWMNEDSDAHTVSSVGGGPLYSGSLGRQQRYSYMFSSPGTYDYRCDIHPDMRGTVRMS